MDILDTADRLAREGAFGERTRRVVEAVAPRPTQQPAGTTPPAARPPVPEAAAASVATNAQPAWRRWLVPAAVLGAVGVVAWLIMRRKKG
jgi:hypothetical protein